MSLTSHYDVVIVGGGPAGLSAALLLGRGRRKTLVVDAGRPRNAAATVSHGFLTRDGVPPAELIAIAREQLKAYPNVEIVDDTVTDVAPHGWVLLVSTAGGQIHRARRAIFAMGAVDRIPDVPGLAECWAKSIFPCPYCHAWDFRDQPLAFLGNGPGVFQNLALLRSWTKDVALLTNGPPTMSHNERMLLHRNGVPVYDQPITSFEHDAGQLTRVVFKDGRVLSRKGILYHPPLDRPPELLARLGLIENGSMKVNPQTAQTANPKIYVAGDLIGLFQPNILSAAVYSGSFAAKNVHQDLALEDFTATVQ